MCAVIEFPMSYSSSCMCAYALHTLTTCGLKSDAAVEMSNGQLGATLYECIKVCKQLMLMFTSFITSLNTFLVSLWSQSLVSHLIIHNIFCNYLPSWSQIDD